jgi:hypothetical protein
MIRDESKVIHDAALTKADMFVEKDGKMVDTGNTY